jgi:hypothetical protein
MSGIGEGILVELIVKVLTKSISLASRILQDSQKFRDQKHDFEVRLNVQIVMRREVQKLLRNPFVSTMIEPHDRHTYYHVIRKLHGLLTDYVKKTASPTFDEKGFLEEHSAEELYREIELKDPSLSEPSPMQQTAWNRRKESVIWALQGRQQLEKLVIGAEAWGDCLATLISIVIPKVFLRGHLSTTEMAQAFPGESLTAANIKGQILFGREAKETATGETANSGGRARGMNSTMLNHQYVRLVGNGNRNPELTKRNELGDSRRWASFQDEAENIKESPVIVEFKERAPIRNAIDHQRDLDIKKDLRSLVRELRLAAQGEKTFHMLYSRGFYETVDHYCLVYRVPPSLRSDSCHTLADILMDDRLKRSFSRKLRNRTELAVSLANSLFHLHSVQWVHKSFKSDNVILFGHEDGHDLAFDWSLAGFTTSRNDRGI